MSTVKELIERYNAEQVCDRLLAVVDGKKEYIADVGNGGFSLTNVGLKLQQEWEQAQASLKAEAEAKTDKPAKGKKPKEASVNVDNDDLLAGLAE